MSQFPVRRRSLIQTLSAGLVLPSLAPAILANVQDRPQMTDGVQSGDLLGDRAMVWSRSDRPAKLVVEWDTTSTLLSPGAPLRRRHMQALTTPPGLNSEGCPPINLSFIAPGSRTPAPEQRANRGSGTCAVCQGSRGTFVLYGVVIRSVKGSASTLT